jgi:hypothetical protein
MSATSPNRTLDYLEEQPPIPEHPDRNDDSEFDTEDLHVEPTSSEVIPTLSQDTRELTGNMGDLSFQPETTAEPSAQREA